MYGRKSQIESTDFVIAIMIFLFILISYYFYTTNISKQDSLVTSDIISDSKTISESLTSGGFPDNWKASNVVRIGFTDGDNRIDTEKFIEFVKIDYNESKKLLGTGYEYFLFFVNESEDVQNVEGFCGTGYPAVNLSYDISAAYYYKGENSDQFLKDFMGDHFETSIYTEDGSESDAIGSLCDLTNHITNYGVVVVEAPEMPTGEPCGMFGAFKDAVEPWIQRGGFFMISGELVAGQKKEFAGGTFEKDAGLSSPQEHATVVNEDEYLDFEYSAGLIFDQGFTAEDAGLAPPNNAVDFIDIARFNESDMELDDILDNKIAIARWNYGEGKIFFFSDFDTNYLVGDFQKILEASTKKWIGAQCLSIDISNIEREDLVKVDRLLVYKSDVLKMVLYVWA